MKHHALNWRVCVFFSLDNSDVVNPFSVAEALRYMAIFACAFPPHITSSVLPRMPNIPTQSIAHARYLLLRRSETPTITIATRATIHTMGTRKVITLPDKKGD